MTCDLIADLRKAEQLPTAPGVAIRIVELNQDDEVDIDELVEVLSQDPALVAKLLKTANSSMFGVPREISGVRDAVMVLGLRSVNPGLLAYFRLQRATRWQLLWRLQQRITVSKRMSNRQHRRTRRELKRRRRRRVRLLRRS